MRTKTSDGKKLSHTLEELRAKRRIVLSDIRNPELLTREIERVRSLIHEKRSELDMLESKLSRLEDRANMDGHERLTAIDNDIKECVESMREAEAAPLIAKLQELLNGET